MKVYASPSFTERGVVFVSFFTPNYQEHGMELIRTLRKFGLEYHVHGFRKQRSWQSVVRSKPAFMLEMLEKHPQARGIVWVDADAEVRNRPDVLFRLKCQIAAPVLHWKNDVKEIVCNVMFLSQTPKTHAIVKAWIKATKRVDPDAETPEQIALQNLIWPDESKKDEKTILVKFQELPSWYSWRMPDKIQRIVFWQKQASRQHNPQQVRKRVERTARARKRAADEKKKIEAEKIEAEKNAEEKK